jgi:DNA-binding transcriptional ArsR family regulator
VPQDAATGRFQLKPAQQRVLAAMAERADSDLTRGQYEELAGVSRSQAAYDLAELVEAGIVHRVGKGRATRYRLAREESGQRHWTSERIRAELEAFCAGREAWPSAAEFKGAGRGDLYVAASRYGGIGYWSRELGFGRPLKRARSSARLRSSPRGKLAWAGAGALTALGLAAAAWAAVFGLTRDPAPVAPIASPPTAPAGVVGHPARPRANEPLRPPQTRRVTTKKGRGQNVRRPREQRTGRTSASLITHSSPLHSSSPPGQSSSTVSAAARRYTSAATAQSGPAPLRAPSSASAPVPLRAP